MSNDIYGWTFDISNSMEIILIQWDFIWSAIILFYSLYSLYSIIYKIIIVKICSNFRLIFAY